MSSATIDIGNLTVYDAKLINLNEAKTNLNNYLKQLCAEATQLLINEVFTLPTETVEDTVVAQLPKPTTILPREKPLPKEKPPTKWELFAKLKGIQNRKKSRMVYDEASKEYRPRYGYKRANDDTKDWLIEVKDNEKDPNQDFFAMRTQAKTERKAKNELQRLRNIAHSRNDKVRGISLLPNDKPSKLEVRSTMVTETYISHNLLF
jgi:regulator of ribosome biosynthesis